MRVFQQDGLAVRSLGTTPNGTSTVIGITDAFSVMILVHRSEKEALAEAFTPPPRTRTIRVGSVVIYVQYVAKTGLLPVVPWRVARAVVALRHGG